MNARTTQILIGAVAAIALFGGGFAVGRTLAPAPATDTAAPTAATGGNAAAQAARRAAGQGAAGPNAPGAAGQGTAGRVISVNDGSITIEVRAPGPAGASPATTTSTIALIGAETRLLKTVEQEIKLADIKAGDQVTVIGTSDATTGTVSANAVLVGGGALQQIFGGQRPAGGARVPGASPSASPRPR